MSKMSVKDLEKYYEEDILPEYNIDADVDLSWKNHEKIDVNTFAHHFIKEDINYILVFEKKIDPLNTIARTRNILLPSHNAYKNNYIFIEIKPSVGYIENITGYYSLYYE